MELTTILLILFGVALILILLSYAFCGVLAFPFFLVGLFFRLLFFPLQLIDTIFYPVGTLPYLIVLGYLSYIVALLLIDIVKLVFDRKK